MLQDAGKTITTILHFLENIKAFCKYFNETPPPHSRLSKTQRVSVIRSLTAATNTIRKGVTPHRINTLHKKMKRLVPKRTLPKCQEVAKAKIPQILGKTQF